MISSRRRFCAFLTFGLLFTGCAQQEPAKDTASTPTTATAPSEAISSLKIGLITPGKINDKGWSQLASDSVEKIKGEIAGTETVPAIEDPGQANVAGAARDLAKKGCNLIFFHASEYDDAAATVAKEFPKTYFVVVGGRSTGANLTPIQFQAGEATYLAGMLAGGMTKTGKVACVGGSEIPIVKEAFASFEKGVKAARADAEVKIVFTGSGDDIAKAKQQAQALLDSGVDVLHHNANAAGQGVAQAVTDKADAMFIGANAPQDDLATPKNLGSFLVDAQAAYLLVAKAVKAGKVPYSMDPNTMGAFRYGLKDKVVGLHYNEKFAGKVSDELKAKIAAAEADIIAGKVAP
ncbi:BMP family protein [Armatimonas sp.]|uniref:BMP family protein n=1 Tax=Armatimonas sp. TaxID=1872638 RepID=UPI00374D6C12